MKWSPCVLSSFDCCIDGDLRRYPLPVDHRAWPSLRNGVLGSISRPEVILCPHMVSFFYSLYIFLLYIFILYEDTFTFTPAPLKSTGRIVWWLRAFFECKETGCRVRFWNLFAYNYLLFRILLPSFCSYLKTYELEKRNVAWEPYRRFLISYIGRYNELREGEKGQSKRVLPGNHTED